jgi:hypothetical protein
VSLILQLGWPDHGLTVQRGTSKLFMLGYAWVFSVSVMHFVGNLCAYRMESSGAVEEKRKSTKKLDMRYDNDTSMYLTATR